MFTSLKVNDSREEMRGREQMIQAAKAESEHKQGTLSLNATDTEKHPEGEMEEGCGAAETSPEGT